MEWWECIFRGWWVLLVRYVTLLAERLHKQRLWPAAGGDAEQQPSVIMVVCWESTSW